ncbi:hypothetical protein D3C80_1013570 [compost metagenome]
MAPAFVALSVRDAVAQMAVSLPRFTTGAGMVVTTVPGVVIEQPCVFLIVTLYVPAAVTFRVCVVGPLLQI